MPRCEASVDSNGVGYRPFQCSRNATIERNGKWYCKQHDPEAIKERQLRRYVEWKRKFDEDARLRREAEAKQAEIERKAALADELAAAANLACQNFERQNISGNFLGDDEHEAWTALRTALQKLEQR